MASGVVHEHYTRRLWILIIPLGLGVFIVSGDVLYPFFFYLNYLLVEISSPDLDHSARNKDETDAIKFFRTISLGFFIPKNKRNKMFWVWGYRVLDRINLGIVGALYVAWSQIFSFSCEEAARLVGKKSGHRVWLSHRIFIGTISRTIWFNIPFFVLYNYMVNYSIVNWGTPYWDKIGLRYFWANIWFYPYIITQFITWFIADGMHILLDTEWAKGRLYNFKKFGDKRTKKLKKILKLLKIEDKDINK